MMKNRFAGELMDKLHRLFEAGITVHTQIVCCPAITTVRFKTHLCRFARAGAEC